MGTCPATGKPIKESDIKGNKRLEELGNELVEQVMAALHGQVPEIEIKNRIMGKVAKISEIEDTGLADLLMTKESEQELKDFVKEMIMNKKAMGSTSFSNFSKQASELFLQAKSHIDSNTAAGFLNTVSENVKNLGNDITVKANKGFEDLKVKVGGVIYDPFTALETGDGKKEMDLYHAILRDNSVTIADADMTPAQKVMKKQALIDRAFLKKNIKIKDKEQMELTIASMNFDNKALMGLRKREGKINKIYDFFLGSERARVTLEERDAAFKVFKEKYGDVFKGIKDEQNIESIFNYLGDYDNFENGVDLFNESGRSLLSSYKKLEKIHNRFYDQLELTDLLKVAKDFQKSPEELIRHNVAGRAKYDVVSSKFGSVPKKTLDEVSKLVDAHIPGGAQKDAFNKNIGIYNDAIEAAFFPNKPNFLSSSVGKMMLEMGYIPISKSLALMDAGGRHLFESTSAMNKMTAIDGKISPKNFKTVFGRAMLHAEGMMVRETMNTLGTLPGFKAYNKQLEFLATKMDLSGLSGVSMDVQIKYAEGIEATMANVHTYAGVIDTRRSMKKPEGVFGKVGAFVSQFSLLTPLDQFAGIMSSQHTQVYMDSIVKDFDNAMKNPAIRNKLERFGVTKEKAQLLKIMLDSQGEERWRPFKKAHYNTDEVNRLVDESLIPKTDADLSFNDRSDYNNHVVDLEMAKLVDFHFSGDVRYTDFFRGEFSKILEKNFPDATWTHEDFNFSKDFKTGEIDVELKDPDNAKLGSEKKKINSAIFEKLNEVVANKRKDLNLEVRNKEHDFKDIKDFIELKYDLDDNAKHIAANRKKDVMLKSIMDFEGHLFQHLSSPKPSLEMDIALRSLDKNAHAMWTTNLLMKNKMQFMSTVTSIVQQASTMSRDFGAHIDKGNKGFNTNNYKLGAHAASSLLLSAAYMGIMNNVKDQLTTGDTDWSAGTISSKALTDSILFSAAGSYVNKYDSFSSKFAYDVITRNKNAYFSLAEKNPLLYNHFTRETMEQWKAK